MSKRRCEALSKVPQGMVSLDGYADALRDESELATDESETCRRIREFVDQLSGNERTIIEALFGLKDGLEPKTTEEVGRLLGISARRVRQVVKERFKS